MSWSISFIGKPENVIKALQEESTKLQGQSKVEYDAALPHLVGLVGNNFAQGDNNIALRIVASCHGFANGEAQMQRQCQVVIEPNWTKLV